MAGRPVRYEVESGAGPLWASEPFRIFFPLGLAAGTVGLLLWPLHFAGAWALYPALQHPRMLIFGFGAAFVYGFLGTAWPRFLEAKALRRWEVFCLAVAWTGSQIAYGTGAIARGDAVAFIGGLFFLSVLGSRLLRKNREWPPPGFALAFFAVGTGVATLFLWARGIGREDVAFQHFLRLVAYQGFLLLPLLGVGSYLFARFFAVPGRPPAAVARRGLVVWLAAGLVMASFVVEAWLSVQWGNALRLAAFLGWIGWALPGIWKGKAPGTRPWALRMGLAMIALAFLCRAIWPRPPFAFEHLLFLGGFAQSILLVGDRVVWGHCEDPESLAPRSVMWRWVVWLVILAAATRATADLVPSTRVSHLVYASIMLASVWVVWISAHGRRLWHRPPAPEAGSEKRRG
jgi:uncharacterized protein involved in response to NO